MKVVIDIPEEEYKEIAPFLNGETIKGGFNLFKALEIIKNGTPLPDGAEILTKEAYSDLCMSAAEQLEKRTEERTETHACDCISRQAVIDNIKTRLYQTALNNPEYITSYADVCDDIAENRIDTWVNEVKSVEPERKIGRWEWDQRAGEYVCSECGCNPIYERTTPDVSEIYNYKYCRWCGAKMEMGE